MNASLGCGANLNFVETNRLNTFVRDRTVKFVKNSKGTEVKPSNLIKIHLIKPKTK